MVKRIEYDSFGENDAETGMWTAKDPIGFDDWDTNLYRYVLQDRNNIYRFNI